MQLPWCGVIQQSRPPASEGGSLPRSLPQEQ